jgi:single-strand DNA-binding protein
MGKHKDTQLNLLILEGRLTRDAELKYTADGKPYVKTAMAHSQGFGDKKRTFFLDITWFGGKAAERIASEMRKGAGVIAQGRIEEDVWEGRDGDTRKKIVMLADKVNLTEWPDDAPDTAEKTPPRAPQAAPEYQQPDDDIPF